MPDSLRYLIILGILAGAVFASAWWLSQNPPDTAEITKSISHDRLRTK